MPAQDASAFYGDGRRYDLITAALSGNAPVMFYKACARRFSDPVLELAAGTGRLAIPIAEDGMEIVGMDSSTAMLAEARRKAPPELPVTWAHGDMRRFDLGRRFQFIFIGSNSFSHLYSRVEIELCLACVHRHLARSGRFMVEVFNPALGHFARPADKRIPVTSWQDARSGSPVEVSKTVGYDSASHIAQETWFIRDGDGEMEIPLHLRLFFPQELDALLYYNGFAVEHKYGSYEGEPFTHTSRKQIVVCVSR